MSRPLTNSRLAVEADLAGATGDGWITSMQIQKKRGLSKPTVNACLRQLLAENVVERREVSEHISATRNTSRWFEYRIKAEVRHG